MLRYHAILIILLAAVCHISADSLSLPNETLHYKVLYKWGIIHKQAGRATLELRGAKDTVYKASLYARSEPWADRFYRVRDTLHSTIGHSDMAPILYERIAHEDGKYARDIVKFTRKNNSVTGHCTRYRRNKKSKETDMSTSILQADGMTVDLLSSFYYLRTLDFETMQQGHATAVNIFSGKRKELLKITYFGIDKVKIDGSEKQAYKIKFTFTSEGKKNTSDPIEAWLSADKRRIPLKLVGHLKIGQIQCYYTEKEYR